MFSCPYSARLEVELLEERNAPAATAINPATSFPPPTSGISASGQQSQSSVIPAQTNSTTPSAVNPGEPSVNGFSTGPTAFVPGTPVRNELNANVVPDNNGLSLLDGAGLNTGLNSQTLLSPALSQNPFALTSEGGTVSLNGPAPNGVVAFSRNASLSGLAPFRANPLDRTGVNGIAPDLPTYDLDYTRIGPFNKGSGTPLPAANNSSPPVYPVDAEETPEVDAFFMELLDSAESPSTRR